ncbi:unnamed protein product [marine sediment metagenome]|uniref:Uncharacterized protein n=1 Tax=marine sediment metagenome TaxID=412755 RepID=X0VMW1_9ZZZZ
MKTKLKISDESIKELCELKVEIKHLEARYKYLSNLAKEAFVAKFPGDSVNEEKKVGGYRVLYSKKPKKVYNINLVEKLPKNLIKQIATLNTVKVDKLLSTKLTPKQCQDILKAKKFEGFNERICTETDGELIRKILEGKKKNAKVSIKVLR